MTPIPLRANIADARFSVIVRWIIGTFYANMPQKYPIGDVAAAAA